MSLVPTSQALFRDTPTASTLPFISLKQLCLLSPQGKGDVLACQFKERAKGSSHCRGRLPHCHAGELEPVSVWIGQVCMSDADILVDTCHLIIVAKGLQPTLELLAEC